MAYDPKVMADPSVDVIQERRALHLALSESATRLVSDAQRFFLAWQTRWNDPPIKQELSALSAELLEQLEGLRQEFRRPEGPAQPAVSQLLGGLLGTLDQPGPLTRLQTLAGDDQTALSLHGQQQLSEVDALLIQLHSLRGQWQDYLTVVRQPEPQFSRTPTQPLLPPPRRRPAEAAPAPSLPQDEEEWQPPPGTIITDHLVPPQQQNARADARQGASSTLKVTLTLGAVLLLLVFLAYEAVAHLPTTANQMSSRAGTTTTSPSAPTATLAPEPTYTPLPSPSPTPVGQPTATATQGTSVTETPAPGSSVLTVNPPVLLVPCPGNGAATLQLVNTGAQPLNWQATPSDSSVLLDGAASEQGHLNPTDVALVSVTAQTQIAQGTIAITYTGGASPVSVSYMISC